MIRFFFNKIYFSFLYKLSLFFILAVCFLNAEELTTNPYLTAALSSEPSSIIGGCVNAITGDFVFSSQDLVADGAYSLDLNHIYTSRYRKTDFPGGRFLAEHLAIISELNKSFIITLPDGIQLRYVMPCYNLKGKQIEKHFKSDITLQLSEESLKGLANTSNLESSGRSNIKNIEVIYNQEQEQIIVKCPDGSCRYYFAWKYSPKKILDKMDVDKKNYYTTFELAASSTMFKFSYFLLDKEQLSDGSWIKYSYDGDQYYLTNIRSTNISDSKTYSNIAISYGGNIVCKTSCSKILNMKCTINKQTIDQIIGWSEKKKEWKTKKIDAIKGFSYLNKECPENPNQSFNYLNSDGQVISDFIFPDKRQIHIEYYTLGNHNVNNTNISIADTQDERFMRVKSINVLKENQLEPLYYFVYHLGVVGKSGGSTEVYDCDFNKTIYSYSSNLQLEEIIRYVLKNDQYVLVNSEKLVWGKEGTSDFTFLLAKSFFDSNSRAIFAKRYFYDERGNIVKEVFFGNLTSLNNKTIEFENGLPKSSSDTFSKYRTFSNDMKNLLIKEEDDSGLIVSYTYLNDTDKISSKITSYKNDQNIKKRTFYKYDEDLILIRQIDDDGSSFNEDDLKNVTERLIKIIHPIKQNLNYGLTDSIEEFYLDLKTNNQILFKKERYEYNQNRRIIRKDIYGSDGLFKYSLKYTYDKKGNLASQTNPLDQKATYEYDSNNNKIEEVDFSGKKISYIYDNLNRLTKKIVYDAENQYTQEYGYDLKNNKIYETDIYGNVTTYKYDAFNNLIQEILPAVQGPPVQELQDESTSYKNPIKSYKYDDLNRQIEKTDPVLNTTKITYNAYNKPLLIEYPNNTTEQNFYNTDGTLKENINPEDTITRYEYDYQKRITSKKVISSAGKDLREEFFEYDAFNLISKKDADGNILKFTYDGATRKIKEEFFDKENNLLSIREYFYDELGFLSKKNEGKNLATIYVRDNLGRVLEERKEIVNEAFFNKKVFDNENVLFKIRYVYDEAGNQKVITSFITKKESSEYRFYDVFNRLIKSQDALKNFLNIFYPFQPNQKYKIVVTENAINQKTIKTYDALDREIKVEETNPQGSTISLEEKFYDLNNNLSLQKSTVYDLTSLKPIKQTFNHFEYDQMNNLILIKEAYNSKDEKTTRYSYTKTNNLLVTVKPDGTKLINEYDSFGNKTRVYSSKKDIDYQFVYNNLNQLIESTDNLTTQKTLKKYDAKGDLIEEKQLSNLKIENEYDLLGNRTKCFLSDKTARAICVEYLYDPLNLKEIIRKDFMGNILYKHEFLDYDLSGNLLKERLILDCGDIEYDLDALSRVKAIKTKYHTQKAKYDPIGRIANIKWEGFLEDDENFEYDDLNQIILEKGRFSNRYSFDSHNNRLKKNDDLYKINDINQITFITNQNDEFEYDKNGNPIFRKKTDGKNIRYYYDSLDRLTKIEGYDYILEFGYDAFNRRIFKKVSKYFYSSLGWKETDFRYFLYDDQNEIGSFDKNLNQMELRILSDSEDAEIGSIAFEIGNEIYAPIYDISGNVVSVILEGNLKEHYRYSVFGEKKVYTNEIPSYKTSVYNLIYSNPNEYLSSQINNPWQFSSKRLDEESGLVYYGRRYYDPQIGRWLTCDPMGFEDGLNLYAFVLNDPLIKYDLYGLYALPGMFYGLDFSDKVLKGFTSGMWNFGTKTLTGIAGHNDDFIHWNINRDLQRYHQREISRDYINNFSRDWFTNKIHADINNRVFQNVEKWTERGLNTAALYYSAKSAFNLIKPDFSRQLSSLKQLSSKPQLDLLSGRNLYSGIDIERVVKNFKKTATTDLVKPLGRGSTGRTVAKNWKERKAMMEVMRNPKGKKLSKVKMTDPKWRMDEGWVKMARNMDGVEIHWVRNEITGAVDDFKFKNK